MDGTVCSVWVEEIEQLYATYQEAAEDSGLVDVDTPSDIPSTGVGAEGEYEIFMKFAAPYMESGIESIQKALGTASDTIDENNDDALGNIKTPLLDDWRGTAADNFSSYIGKMQSATTRQAELLAAMSVVTRAYGELVRAMQTDFTELVNHAITGLNNKEMEKMEIGATMAGAVAGLAGSVPASLSAVSSVLTTATATAGAMEAASSKADIRASAQLALADLYEAVTSDAAKITEAYGEILTLIKDDMPTVYPPEPMITTEDHFDPDKFGLEDDADFDEVKSEVSTDPLVEQDREAKPQQ